MNQMSKVNKKNIRSIISNPSVTVLQTALSLPNWFRNLSPPQKPFNRSNTLTARADHFNKGLVNVPLGVHEVGVVKIGFAPQR